MRRHFVLTLIGLAVMMMLGLNASTLGAQEVNAPIGFDALTLTLEIPGGRRFLSLEPIPVRLMLENRTGQPIFGHAALKFFSGRARLLVQPDGSAAYRVSDLSPISGPSHLKGQTIQPGARYEATDVLALGLDKIFPPQVGTGSKSPLRDLMRISASRSNRT